MKLFSILLFLTSWALQLNCADALYDRLTPELVKKVYQLDTTQKVEKETLPKAVSMNWLENEFTLYYFLLENKGSVKCTQQDMEKNAKVLGFNYFPDIGPYGAYYEVSKYNRTVNGLTFIYNGSKYHLTAPHRYEDEKRRMNYTVEMAKALLADKEKVKRSFLILKSTKSFQEAKDFALKSANELSLNYAKQDAMIHSDNDLTFSPEACEEMAYAYPCYTTRGAYDDGIYISIEYSDHYEGFSKGYYIVIVASGENIEDYLPLAKKISKDAYITTSPVFTGCTH